MLTLALSTMLQISQPSPAFCLDFENQPHSTSRSDDKKDGRKCAKSQTCTGRYQHLKKHGNDVVKLKKKEILALLWVNYGVALSESAHSKPKLVGILKSKMGQLPETVLAATSCDATGTINEDGIKGSI